MNHKNALNIANLDAPIFRIFSKARFLELFSSGRNGLVNPSKWEDPFENFFLRAQAEGPQGERVSMANIAGGWYGQCWTSNVDTDAMWRIYSPDKDGIKVGTTIRKLFGSFYDDKDRYASLKFFIGKVTYSTEAEITALMSKVTLEDITLGGQGDKFARLLCVKREAFGHENEIRLLYQDTEPSRGAHGVALFDLDINSVGEEAVLDPRLSDGAAAALEHEIRAAGMHITCLAIDALSHARLQNPTFLISTRRALARILHLF